MKKTSLPIRDNLPIIDESIKQEDSFFENFLLIFILILLLEEGVEDNFLIFIIIFLLLT